MSPFFCVRTSPEPYGARAGQRLPAQRLKPQGAEKEKMPVNRKKMLPLVVLAAGVVVLAVVLAVCVDGSRVPFCGDGIC